MISLRAAIVIVCCFIITVGIRCKCCKCDNLDVKYTSTFNKLELTSFDNSGKDTIPVINNTVNRNAFAIKLTLLAFTNMVVHRSCPRFDLFISSASAMGCRCNTYGKYTPTDSISSISITDLEAYDAHTPAGTDITSRFRYMNPYQYNYIEIKNLLRERASLFYTGSYNTYISEPVTQLRSGVLLLLTEPPAGPGTHRFKVTIALQSGATIEQTTPTLTFQ